MGLFLFTGGNSWRGNDHLKHTTNYSLFHDVEICLFPSRLWGRVGMNIIQEFVHPRILDFLLLQRSPHEVVGSDGALFALLPLVLLKGGNPLRRCWRWSYDIHQVWWGRNLSFYRSGGCYRRKLHIRRLHYETLMPFNPLYIQKSQSDDSFWRTNHYTSA